MIISHKHKFIFFKTKKTAGTSIEIALSKYCGVKDIITPISEEDEKIRSTLGYRGAQNFKQKKIVYYSHINVKLVKESLSSEIWNSYYKFCFERNIYEKIISFYYWEHKEEPRPSIKEFLESDALDRLFLGIEAIYMIDDEVVVDDIYNYEELENSFATILKKLSIKDSNFQLPRAKSKYRQNKNNYKNILSPEEIAKIDEIMINKY